MKKISLATARRQKLTHYFTGIPCQRGHLSKRYVSTRECQECTRAAQRRHWPKFKATHLEAILLSSARVRAKAFSVPITITVADIVIPTHCPILGLKLKHGAGGHCAESPSLDRIRPARGYVLGNVIVISHRANALKSNATAKELLAIGKWLAKQEDKP